MTKTQSVFQKVAAYFGAATPRKTGEKKFPGGKMFVLEGGGKTVIVAQKTVFRKGQKVGTQLTGWHALA